MTEKQKEIKEHYETLKEKTRSELHARSLEISETYLKRYPDTWKTEIKTNRELEAIKQLLK